jgi:hypothetical protein
VEPVTTRMPHPPRSNGDSGSLDISEDTVDLVRASLSATWWGPNPWRRYLPLLAALGPALVVERVAAVTNYSHGDAWPILVALDFSHWLQILVGSFVAWYPSSLLLTASVTGVFAGWAVSQTMYASSLTEMRHDKPILVKNYSQLTALLAAVALPAAAMLLTTWMLPRELALLVLLPVVIGWFLVSSLYPDDLRVVRLEFLCRKRRRGKLQNGEAIVAISTATSLRIPPRARQWLASWLVFAVYLMIPASLLWASTSRLPWVPRECIVYTDTGGGGGHDAFWGFVLLEGIQTDLVLRDVDRRVLTLRAAAVLRPGAARPGPASVCG